ncbi:hypothetical protein HNP37_004034 [Flavobacterium nitrogenifigens]|uniref:Carboxypeptidase regulatory-like domain-containing protein n=2 Tax=Flavobacterium TaxID=237 RepID=A0A7W7J0D3_9FLAO|nr:MULTISPECIES: hypothetical protein [Flavobacterium]MBB4803954.1 hypothetical protein [Flavobacterium nitrogenifigens]MBB6388894.1 hypothetical protein [Flavobacterium notoginsengisoli]
MKKTTKIILIIVLILIFGVFIHPKNVIYVPKIKGKVIDEKGNPVNEAVVSRIEELSSINKEHGYFEYTKYQSQTTKTDKNGFFELTEKSRIEWIHTPFDLPFAWCFGNFQIEKNGYKTYQTRFDEFREFHKDNCYACENIEFNPIITLKRK